MQQSSFWDLRTFAGICVLLRGICALFAGSFFLKKMTNHINFPRLVAFWFMWNWDRAVLTGNQVVPWQIASMLAQSLVSTSGHSDRYLQVQHRTKCHQHQDLKRFPGRSLYYRPVSSASTSAVDARWSLHEPGLHQSQLGTPWASGSR